MDFQDFTIYVDNTLSLISSDKSEFGKKILPELKEFITQLLKSVDSDDIDNSQRSLAIIRSAVNFFICFRLDEYCRKYLNIRNIKYQIILHKYKERVSEILEERNFEDIENILPVFNTSELLYGLKLLNDKAIRRILSDRTLAEFDKAYNGVVRNDLQLFSSGIKEDKAKDLGFSWLLEYLRSESFQNTVETLLSDSTNQEFLYEYSNAIMPHVATLLKLKNSDDLSEKTMLDIILNKYPFAIKEIKQNLDYYLTIPELSSYSKRHFESLLKYYDFIFVDGKDLDLPLQPDNLKVLIPMMCRLVNLTINYHQHQFSENESSEMYTSSNNLEEHSSEPITSKHTKSSKNRFTFPNVIGIQEPSKKLAFLDSLYQLLYTNFRSTSGEITEDQFKYLFGAYGMTQPLDYPYSFIWTGQKYQFALLLRILFDAEEQKTAQNGFIVLNEDYVKRKYTKWTSGTSIQSSKLNGPSEKMKTFAKKIMNLIRQQGGSYKGDLPWVKDL